MEVVEASNYSPPIDKLLTYGQPDPAQPEKWPNYLESGIGPEHIPDLIHMATDEQLHQADSESLEVWAQGWYGVPKSGRKRLFVALVADVALVAIVSDVADAASEKRG